MGQRRERRKVFGVVVRALSIVSGILAVFCVFGTVGNLSSGTVNVSDFIITAAFIAACWFAAKKAKDPARKERIRAKKEARTAEKAAKKEQKAAVAAERKRMQEQREAERMERVMADGGRKAEKAAKRAQREAEAEEWERKYKEQREINRLERERRARERIRDNTPVAAVVVAAQDKTKTSGGLGSAVVGGMIAGPVGAVVGASLGKKTTVTGQKVTFSVRYESGRTGVETVEVNSKRFKELSALLMK